MEVFSEKDKLELWHPYQLSPELVSQAQFTVCSLATDAEDAKFLFDVLGLPGA